MQRLWTMETPTNKPYRKYEVLAPLGVFAVGLVVILFLYVIDIAGVVNEEIRLEAPGRHEIHLPGSGEYRISYVQESPELFMFPTGAGERALQAQIELTRAVSERPVPIQTEEITYYAGPYSGTTLFTFRVDQGGTYWADLDITEADSANGTFLLVPDIDKKLQNLYAMLTITLIATMLTFVFARLWKRRARAAAA